MWTDGERALLTLILDELIPSSADGRVPGAGALGVADGLLTVAPREPDPRSAISAVLADVAARSGDFAALDRPARVVVLRAAEAALGAEFARLVRLAYMGYYSQPETRPLFGVGAHPVHPTGYAVAPESAETLDQLTAPVRARGPLYRDGRTLRQGGEG